jgi:hypothetical protein
LVRPTSGLAPREPVTIGDNGTRLVNSASITFGRLALVTFLGNLFATYPVRHSYVNVNLANANCRGPRPDTNYRTMKPRSLVLPHRKTRTRRAPRVEHLGVRARSRVQPLKEIENQVSEIFRHGDPPRQLQSFRLNTESARVKARVELVRWAPSSNVLASTPQVTALCLEYGICSDGAYEFSYTCFPAASS